MAIEGVMKIFLMIAVIIVGMSFLMKAFGIDIIGWLKDKFTGFDLPSEGKAVHIKIDSDDSPIELWEFHLLTDSQAEHHGTERLQDKFFIKVGPGPTTHNMFFFPGDSLDKKDDISAGRCVIFASKEGDGLDKAAFYYVLPGSTIQSIGCTSPYDCLTDPKREWNGLQVITGHGDRCTSGDPDSKCASEDSGDTKCGGRSHYVNCAGGSPFGEPLVGGPGDVSDTELDKNDMLQHPFGTGEIRSDCINEPATCNLLAESKEEFEYLRDSNTYQVKFGVLCDSNGEWRTCSDKTEPTHYETKDVVADCESNGGLWGWSIKKAPSGPTCIPLGFSLDEIKEDRVKMKWALTEGATKYRLEWCLSGYHKTNWDTSLGPAVCFYTETQNIDAKAIGLEPGTSYNFRLRVETSDEGICKSPGEWKEQHLIATKGWTSNHPWDEFTLANGCNVRLTSFAKDESDGSDGRYSAPTERPALLLEERLSERAVIFDDDPSAGGEDVDMVFINSWSGVSPSMTITTWVGRHEADHKIRQGYEITSSNCGVSYRIVQGVPAEISAVANGLKVLYNDPKKELSLTLPQTSGIIQFTFSPRS